MFGITKGPHFSDNLPKTGNGLVVDSFGGSGLPAKVGTFFKRASQISRGLVAAEILNWADQKELPNQFTFIKDVIGMAADWGNKNNQYKAQFDRVFNTLGNKKVEWNDILAFPLNLIAGPFISKSFDGKDKNKNNKKKQEEDPKVSGVVEAD